MVVGGKPLIAHTILQARASQRIDRVLVSTDDRDIADIARKWGADVPFLRPAEFARDSSPDIDVFRHALQWLAEHEQYLPSLVVHLRPPTPVRRVELIDQAIDLLASHPDADAVRSVNVAQQTPYKMWHIRRDGYLEPVVQMEGFSDSQSLPRQQLPIVYWQNGYVDVIRPRAALEKNSMWGDRALPLLIEEPLLELDYPEQIPAIEQALRDTSTRKSPPSESPFRHPV
jgi:N-acylneuraminate cytidylyltransferase